MVRIQPEWLIKVDKEYGKNEVEKFGWKEQMKDSYSLGIFELRKLNAGNWVFRHERKEKVYIDLEDQLTVEKLEMINTVIKVLSKN